MAIEVLDPGLLTTIQDLGRTGFQRYGIPPCGAADPYALRIGNLLLGNEEGEAALEVTLIGPTLRFETDCWIAITGADLGANLNNEEVPLWETIPVARGDILSFRSPRSGFRAYIAIAGGIILPPILGSKSTYLRAHLGGLEGRPLREGDRLLINPTSAKHRRLPREFIPDYRLRDIRVIIGPNEEWFVPETIRTFLSSEYEVLPESDRMGLRLRGPKIEHAKGADIISEPVSTGAIQVPGNGQPIVLLADRQTTGGYPKIATVISADLYKLGQAKPGDVISFEACSLEQAQQLLRESEKMFFQIKEAIAQGKFDCRSRLKIRTGFRVYNVEIIRQGAREFVVSVGGTSYEITLIEREQRVHPLPSSGKVYIVKAPMPGVIRDIFVMPGAKVNKGDRVLVLEALKMENVLLSPASGVVSEVKVEKGTQVEAGQALVVVTGSEALVERTQSED